MHPEQKALIPTLMDAKFLQLQDHLSEICHPKAGGAFVGRSLGGMLTHHNLIFG
jgi:hypothetical protein